MSPIKVGPFQATISDVFADFFAVDFKVLKVIPQIGLTPKVITQELYLEMVPSSPQIMLLRALCG